MIKNRVLTLDNHTLYGDSVDYFRKICGFQKDNEMHARQLEEALDLITQYEDQFTLKTVISVCPPECIKENKICLGQIEISREELNRITKDMIKAVCLYAMCISKEKELKELDLLEQFYLDTWMTACLDAGRDWLRRYLGQELKQKMGSPVFMTHAFGPGFYGMSIEEIPRLFKIIDGSKIGIRMVHGAMYPPKSNLGFYLAMKEKTDLQERDCKHCLSHNKNCMFCKNNQILE